MHSLLDVNVPVALLDRNHEKRQDTANWFNSNYADGWLSCPLPQNGCIRILSQPRYPNRLDISEAIRRLQSTISDEHHSFIPDDVSLFDQALIDLSTLSGFRQLTDVYLLALAVAHDARLVTLDTRIPLHAVHGATEEHLVVI